MYARESALIATPIGGVSISGKEQRIYAIRIEQGAIGRTCARNPFPIVVSWLDAGGTIGACSAREGAGDQRMAARS